ncbi:acetyl-CoA carboxylase biotin carboxyl carrier protein [Defluviicoccus vanus]|uniref:Biotin carboxyl carrier protein of acetyl-CoA carboxylase n=1 Tax=Defluviicoccus vanus TaxID=111831 RepID=A0A7H1MXT1_9PROT|nr:acetyl-CoA carboxylase biotin carboxyl carrier protein subunit [Defluviicoccus vanus]QNT68267.1 acetyl-CoA carboxylase biotin carboxyl carrier protein [Defluviicoccus vanus]
MTPPRKPKSASAALVRELALLLDETNLTEIELVEGELRIRVARTAFAPMAPASYPHVGDTATATPREDAAPAPHPGLITSPMVGVVYTSPEPSLPAFVNVGDTVAEGTTLLLIEAMKVFNPITAPRAGRVVSVFVTNGSPVEYGEPLLVIE